MGEGKRGRRGMVELAAALLGLAACAGPTMPIRPEVKDPVGLAVQELLANQAEGRLGSVRGFGSIQASIPVPLADGEVVLLPSAPRLEVALGSFNRRWQEGRRRPLPFEVGQETFSVMTAHRAAVGRFGGQSLVRFAKTDQQGQFTFEQVPAGRWLVVTDMSSPVSALLWAVLVEVRAGDTARVALGDANILLEAQREKAGGRSTP